MSAALQNAKGPARIAVLPSHGPIIPQKDMKMNTSKPITGSTEAPALSRRSFLGGVAITAIPLASTRALANPSARERAEFHWQQFAAAMNELTVDMHGWSVMGGKRRDFLHINGQEWSNRHAIEYRVDHDPRLSRPFVSEHMVSADLGGTGL